MIRRSIEELRQVLETLPESEGKLQASIFVEVFQLLMLHEKEIEQLKTRLNNCKCGECVNDD